MKIEYVGHSCFHVTTQAGRTLLLDPFSPGGSCPIVRRRADITLISHGHPDHSATEMILGPSLIIQGAGVHDSHGTGIRGFLMDHGHADGRWLGMTICYRIQADGLTCLHLSDAGVVPDAAQVKEFGPVDILFVPVGGHFTLDGEGARQAIDMINPAVAIPMHYRGPYTLRDQFPIEGVEPFLRGLKNVSIRREQQVEITLETLPPKKSVWVLTPAL